MAERRSALAEVYREGVYGRATPESAGVRLAERRGLSLALVSCRPEESEAVSGKLAAAFGLRPPETATAASAGALSLLWHGPQRWLAVEAPGQPELEGRLRRALAGVTTLAVNDLSHARTVVRLEGPALRDLLASFTALDLDPRAFPAGAVALTAFGHFSVLLHASGQDRIDLYVLRSFGQALWEELTEQAASFGCLVGPVTV